MQQRRRFKQASPLDERLVLEALRLRKQASEASVMADRETLLRRARQYETASHMDGYLRSNDLRPPQ